MRQSSVNNTVSTKWKCTGPKNRKHPVIELDTDETCPLCKQQSIVAYPVMGIQLNKRVWAAAAVIAILVGGSAYSVTQLLNACPSGQQRQERVCYVPEWFSSGEQLLFSGRPNTDSQRGVDAFKSGRYAEAGQFFKNALLADRFEPEPQIYLNNAQARQSKHPPLVLAAVVPINSRADQARELLRGIADAQTQFNKVGGINGRLLEILIVNDNNDPDQATQVAQRLIHTSDVLGVIGHNASGASLAGLAVYETVNPPLAMVSPTSSSIDLKGENFFRTVLSDRASSKALAVHLKNELNVKRTAIFYNPDDSYSSSIATVFEQEFRRLGGQVVRKINLNAPQLNVERELRKLQNDRIYSALLFPNTDLTSVAIRVAKVNANQSDKLLLLGSDSLYSQDTLKTGGSAVKGLVLAVSWFADSQSYAQLAEDRWGGRVSWRTAASFDATQALIRALSSSTPTRTSVLNNLRSIAVASTQTSGQPVQFSTSGDLLRSPILIEVVHKTATHYDFQPVQP